MRNSKKAQVTIFIIAAIVIIAGIVIFFVAQSAIKPPAVGMNFDLVYNQFESCIKSAAVEGIKTAGSQAGYIEVPEFSPGSRFAPFSSQLNFLGTSVPYWYYVSGNNLIKEQVPSKITIEKQLGNYIDSQLSYCDFSEFKESGYNIDIGNPKTTVKIYDDRVDIQVDSGFNVAKGNFSARKVSHETSVDSKFGKFYNLAREIYTQEKQEAFLENYSVDILRSYAPVTGVELSCSPKIWDAQDVVDELKNGISANMAMLKVNGNYYNSKINSNSKYFIVDSIKSDEKVNFMYSTDWPTRVEIWPAENQFLVAEPVGLEQGMGIIGFCYIPYNFIYDVYFPVLVQINDGNELFQFPVAVVIDKNVARQSIAGETLEEGGNLDEICGYKNTKVEVFTYDKNLNPIESQISFACMNTECNIGETSLSGNDAKLSTNFPQCVNGKIVAKAEGYVTENYYVSTNEPIIANIMMDKLYDLNLKLVVGGREFSPDEESEQIAVINFESEKNNFVVVYPQQKKIKLSEGYYNVSVQVYGGSNSALTIPSSSSRECVSVPESGIAGFFGKMTDQCFDVTIPEQKLSNALTAGGKSTEYILEDDLQSAEEVTLSVNLLPAPTSLDQLGKNYDLYSRNKISINFE